MTLPFDQTLGQSHPFSVGKNVHSILGNPNSAGTFYADIAARDADTDFQVAENIGKAVAITSPLSIFVLMSIGPAVWLELSNIFNVGDVVGPASATDNALARFDLATGKLIQNSLAILDDAGALIGLTQLQVGNLSLLSDTIINTVSGVNIESSVSDALIMKAPGLGGTPNLFNILTGGVTTVGKFGDLGTSGIDLTATFGQIGWKNFADLELAPRSDSASDIVFYTPNAGLTSLIEALRIKTSTQAVGIGGSPDASSLLDLTSTTLGFLPMRMTTTQRDAIGSPATGLQIDNLTVNELQRFDGSSWIDISPGGDVDGPGSSTDNALARFNLATGKLIQNSLGILNDSGELAGLTKLNLGNLQLSGNTLETTSGDLIFAAPTGVIDVFTSIIRNLTDPVNPQDAATRQFVLDNAGTGDVVGPGSATDNAIVTFDSTTGKIIQEADLTLINQVIRPIFGDSLAFTLKSKLTTAESLLVFEDSATRRMEVGNKSATAFETTLDCAQIIVNNSDTNLTLAPRATAPSEIVLYTSPSTALLERLRIKSTGSIKTFSDTNLALQVEVSGATGTDAIFDLRNTLGSSKKIIRLSTTDAQIVAEIVGDGRPVNPNPMLELNVTDGTVLQNRIHIDGKFGITIFDKTGATITAWNGDDGRIVFTRGIVTKKTNIADADYTLISTDYRIATTSITASRTYTIPTAEIAKGSATEAREWKFKDESGNVSGANKITIATEGAQTIDGATELVVNTPFHDFKIYADGSNCFVEAA